MSFIPTTEKKKRTIFTINVTVDTVETFNHRDVEELTEIVEKFGGTINVSSRREE